MKKDKETIEDKDTATATKIQLCGICKSPT